MTFKAAEWNPSEVDMTVVAIDPSWIKTEDDIVIVKLKYNKDYYDEWARLVVVKNNGDYNDLLSRVSSQLLSPYSKILGSRGSCTNVTFVILRFLLSRRTVLLRRISISCLVT